MLSIAICEDSLPVQSQLETIITDLLPDCPVEVFSSGEDLLAHASQEHFNLYFMDISMPGISGIETAATIRQTDPYALIIYVTDHKEYVYQVFEPLPIRFLIKPVEKNALQHVLSNAVRHLESRLQLFHFHIERCHYQIPMQEIAPQSRVIQLKITCQERTECGNGAYRTDIVLYHAI